MLRSLLLGLACALLGAAASARAADEPSAPRIYRWVDENGITHYTTDPDRIPSSLRRRFGLPAEPMRSAPLDARAPAPAPEPPPAVGPDAWAAQEKGAPPAEPPHATPPVSSPPEWSESAPTDVASAPAATGQRERLAALELRIAELSAAIAADEDALSGWIADPNAGDAIAVGDRPEFREIAKRLPERIEELENLRRERDSLEQAVP